MPIIKREDFGTSRAPDWVKVSEGIPAMGCSTRNNKSDFVEPHFHDSDEFWFAISGKAKVRTEGKQYVVEKGDVVCTKMGDVHEIVEIVEPPYTQVWINCNLRGKKRPGHLHQGEDD